MASSTPLLLSPKIEPKTEPIDDLCIPQTPALPLLEAPPSPHNDCVFSEFARISQMFKSAFSTNPKRPAEPLSLFDDPLNPESGAIVPAATPDDTVVSFPISKRQKRKLMRCNFMPVGENNYDRDIVRKTRLLYDSLLLYSMFESEKRLGPRKRRTERADLRAANIMKNNQLWLHTDKKIVGAIPGIFVGDVFFFRMEMCVVGLHGQPQAGIDYLTTTESENGCPVATSIIVSGGYEDDEDSGEVLVYSGHGGRDSKNKPCCDQKEEGGNLALLKSMEYGYEVRVIRGLKLDGIKCFVYDGLYKIEASWRDVGKSGFSVFKYRLLRIEGQERMGSSTFAFAKTLRTRPLELRPKGYLTLDLSTKREGVSVFLFNDVDFDYVPMCFEYLAKTVFPPFLYQNLTSSIGCGCVDGCSDNCLCGIKNGGEIPYDENGFLLRGKPLIIECGVNCQCPPSCRNRVSQKGLRHRLEVFRSRGRGWSVRTLDLIHAGSFICEYSGVVLSREQAQVLSMSGDNLINPGQFAPNWMKWGDLSKVYPDYIRPSYPSVPPLDFAMDVSSMRNVAFYMVHSQNPNVMTQFVLYDHNNLMFPRIMLFAMEVIPPMKDLTIEYGGQDEYFEKPAICHH